MAVKGPGMGQDLPVAILSLALSYFSYCCLTPAVILMAGILMVILSAMHGGSLPAAPLQYLSFINPKLAQPSYSLNAEDVMQMFTAFAFGLWAFSALVNFAIEKTLKTRITAAMLHKNAIGVALITAVHLAGAASVPFIKIAEGTERGEFFVVFAFFYAICMVCFQAYFFLSEASFRLMSASWKKMA